MSDDRATRRAAAKLREQRHNDEDTTVSSSSSTASSRRGDDDDDSDAPKANKWKNAFQRDVIWEKVHFLCSNTNNGCCYSSLIGIIGWVDDN
jgi:hypothetical protein